MVKIYLNKNHLVRYIWYPSSFYYKKEVTTYQKLPPLKKLEIGVVWFQI